MSIPGAQSTANIPTGPPAPGASARPRRGRRTAVAVGVASALGAAVYAQLHRDEFEAMARRLDMPADPQT